MGFKINELSIPADKKTVHEPHFNRMLESYLPLLRERDDTEVLEVHPHEAHKYEGDFYGLLAHYEVPSRFHWAVLRVNDFNSPTECDDTLESILVPDLGFINRMVQIQRTTGRKKKTEG